MLYWTWASLRASWGRALAGSVGIALGLMLALYLDAVFRGEAAYLVAFIERTPGTVWVLQDGVENLHMAYSSISENAIAEVKRADGIKELTRVVYRPTSLGSRGDEVYVYAVGVPRDEKIRRQWSEATGWPVPKPGTVILPEPMLEGQGLRLGGPVRIGDTYYEVQDVSQGTFSMANPIVLMDEQDARDQFDMGDGASILIIDPVSGMPPDQLAERIQKESDKVSAMTKRILVANDKDLAMQMGAALIGLLSVMGLGVAGLIVVFVIYAFVSANSRELAVAKALGAGRKSLIGAIMFQAGILALIGAGIALLAAVPIEALLITLVPQVAVDFSIGTGLQLSLAVVTVAELAALVPAVYLLRVDPASAFSG